MAIVNADVLFTRTSAQATAAIATKRGMQVVFQEAHPPRNTDFSALLTKLRAASPDVIAASTDLEDAIALTRQMKELNVNLPPGIVQADERVIEADFGR